jgi:hypothetical protein
VANPARFDFHAHLSWPRFGNVAFDQLKMFWSAWILHDFIHVTICGSGGLLGAAAILPGGQVGRVPIPPVMFAVRLLVGVVVLRRFVEKLCQRSHVHSSSRDPASIRDQGIAW